ncbi:MAG: hypothetical protein ACLPVY_08125 [Acidimicrobiia bacterium]
MAFDEEHNGWHPDPFGRFEERYIVYGEPSRLVRSEGVEQTDRRPLTFDTPTDLAVEDRDTAAPWQGRGIVDPVPGTAIADDAQERVAPARTRFRHSRQRVVGLIVVVVACALVAGLMASRRSSRSASSQSAGHQVQPTRTSANIAVSDRPTPRSPQLGAMPPAATPRVGEYVTTAPGTSEIWRTQIMEWANQLASDVNNINEVAYEYGRGALEETACRRTGNDAAKLPTATSRADIAEAVRIAGHEVMSFASGCADVQAQGCRTGRRRCGQLDFADGYRQSVQDLNTVQAELGKT